MTTKTREQKLVEAQKIKAALAELLQSRVPMNQDEFEKACEFYAQAVIMVARLS